MSKWQAKSWINSVCVFFVWLVVYVCEDCSKMNGVCVHICCILTPVRVSMCFFCVCVFVVFVCV